jgi:hypothetical protein
MAILKNITAASFGGDIEHAMTATVKEMPIPLKSNEGKFRAARNAGTLRYHYEVSIECEDTAGNRAKFLDGANGTDFAALKTPDADLTYQEGSLDESPIDNRVIFSNYNSTTITNMRVASVSRSKTNDGEINKLTLNFVSGNEFSVKTSTSGVV